MVTEADVRPGELVVEPGAGIGAFTVALAGRGAEVIAIELDPAWADQLERRVRNHRGRVRVVRGDFLAVRLPTGPYRVIGSAPFGETTAILRHLLDDPDSQLRRVDLIVQWEVARKRAALPPTSLLSTAWAPWWDFQLRGRIPASAFRPVPRVDGGILTITRRSPPLLPVNMATPDAAFVRSQWPFAPQKGHP